MRPYNTPTVTGQLEQSGIKRMKNPGNIQDLIACGFFLFGYMKGQLKGRRFLEKEELFLVLSEFMSEIPPDMIVRFVADWNRRLWLCILAEGENVE
jgi:hypothetical protein